MENIRQLLAIVIVYSKSAVEAACQPLEDLSASHRSRTTVSSRDGYR